MLCPGPKDQGKVVVLAASSMANVLQEIKPEYLADHPCVTDLVFSFGSSATLGAQIVNGSPADVFVSASKSTMDTVTSAGVISTSSQFAKNYAAIMFYKDSKFDENITSLLSLLDALNPGIKVGLCVETAPCGSLADLVLKMVPRFEGPQSDKDTQSYKEAAGQLADPTLPTKIRKEAGKTVLRLMQSRKSQFVNPELASEGISTTQSSGGTGTAQNPIVLK